jgi:hypothetical protein
VPLQAPDEELKIDRHEFAAMLKEANNNIKKIRTCRGTKV